LRGGCLGAEPPLTTLNMVGLRGFKLNPALLTYVVDAPCPDQPDRVAVTGSGGLASGLTLRRSNA